MPQHTPATPLKSLVLVSALAATTYLQAQSSQGADWGLERWGLRTGIDLDEEVSIQLIEGFAALDSPYRWQLGGQFNTELIFEAAFGALRADEDIAALAKVGGGFKFFWGDLPLIARITLSPTLLSRDSLDGWDIGGHFQFTTAGSLEWRFHENLSVGYYIQHTSNAGLDDPNPGIDIHAVFVGIRF